MPRRLIGLLTLALVLLGTGGVLLLNRDKAPARLDCPNDQVHLGPDGVAVCGPGKELTASQKLSVGAKANLNTVSLDELAALPGIGQTLAEAIIARRKELGHFETFEQVDAVSGVGPAKLEALKQMVEIR